MCGRTTGVQPITGTSLKVAAWRCTDCDTSWAITVVNPSLQPYSDRLAGMVEALSAARWILGQVVQLADDADGLTNDELRARSLALAESCARMS